MPDLELTGLDGANPLGFFAALGTLVAADRTTAHGDVRLSWTTTVRPYAILGGFDDLQQLVDTVLEDRDAWFTSPALDYPPSSPWDDVKVSPADVREWLQACRDARSTDGGRSLALSTALVAELSLAGNKEAKPTDLHFTAGRQRFLSMARQLRDELVSEHVHEALAGPWPYESDLPSFMWDVADDRVYALAPTDPASDKKLTVPGAEWLALMGLALFSVVGRPGRTLTPGCSGTWKSGAFTWPIWHEPLSVREVRTLVNRQDLVAEEIPSSIGQTGVGRIFRSQITRSDQGGYGSFRPPRLLLDTR